MTWCQKTSNEPDDQHVGNSCMEISKMFCLRRFVSSITSCIFVANWYWLVSYLQMLLFENKIEASVPMQNFISSNTILKDCYYWKSMGHFYRLCLHSRLYMFVNLKHINNLGYFCEEVYASTTLSRQECFITTLYNSLCDLPIVFLKESVTEKEMPMS